MGNGVEPFQVSGSSIASPKVIHICGVLAPVVAFCTLLKKPVSEHGKEHRLMLLCCRRGAAGVAAAGGHQYSHVLHACHPRAGRPA